MLYFCFARDAGLPVRESWLSYLPQVLAEETRRALSRPVSEEGLVANRIEELVESIKLWMNAETELRVE